MDPTREEVLDVLRRHVIDPWFPRCLDRENGGFLCDFDRAWRESGRHDKLAEFQARQTMFAAEANRAFPDDERLREATIHGWRFLREAMWDAREGGWFHRVDRAGRPLEGATKHAHGAAYAIQACVEVFETTGEREALEDARRGFEWLDRCLHDRHGGYHGMADRAGRAVRAPSRSWRRATDTIGTPLGFTDGNVQSDLLETFLHFLRTQRHPRVEERLAELVDLLGSRMRDRETGGVHFLRDPGGVPVPGSCRAGIDFQTAYRLARARTWGHGDASLVAAAGEIARAAVRRAADPAGGFFVVGAPDVVGAAAALDTAPGLPKSWWVQADSMKAFHALSRLEPDDARWAAAAAAQWRHLRANHFDERHGGTLPAGRESWPVAEAADRIGPPALTFKGSPWKDASHEGRACLLLLETPPAAPPRRPGDGARAALPRTA
jgi:mannobiose 2-epimerase